jgi:hypothetical protein
VWALSGIDSRFAGTVSHYALNYRGSLSLDERMACRCKEGLSGSVQCAKSGSVPTFGLGTSFLK